MVRNTVAVQQGLDPRTAAIAFHWRRNGDGSPASFFPENGPTWYWPGHGIRLPVGPLVVFLYAIVETPGKGLGFAAAGWAVAVIEDPDAPLEAWKPRIVDAAPSQFDAVPATAVVRDGAFVVGLAIRQVCTRAHSSGGRPARSRGASSAGQSGGPTSIEAGCRKACSALAARPSSSTTRVPSAPCIATPERVRSSTSRATASGPRRSVSARRRPSQVRGARRCLRDQQLRVRRSVPGGPPEVVVLAQVRRGPAEHG